MASTARPTGLIAKEGIELLTYRTPNGHKASVFLEELKAAYGISYTFQTIELPHAVNKDPWYLALSPCGKIPVIVDHDHDDFVLSESQAILQYLARTYDKDHIFSFTDPKEVAKCEQWLSFCSGDLTPANIFSIQFYRFIPMREGPSDSFAAQKFIGHAETCYSILDQALEGRDFLVGNGRGKYSVADMACWVLWDCALLSGIPDLERWANLMAWGKRIGDRDAAKRGVEVPFRTVGIRNESFLLRMEENEEFRRREDGMREGLRKAREEYGGKKP